MSILENTIDQLTLNSFKSAGETCITVDRNELLCALQKLKLDTWNGALETAAKEAQVTYKKVGIDFEVVEVIYSVDKQSILKFKV